MALKAQLTVWTPVGDVNIGSAQAGAIGASFGNGAAQFGQSAANPLQMGDDGNLVIDISSAGRSPSATSLDKILSLMTIPAGAFDIANRGIQILGAGNAVTGGTAKTFKIIANPTAPVLGATVSGGTTIASFTATAAGGWQIQANLFKYGLAGSNTQIALHEAGQIGATVGALVAPSLLTLAENAAMNIVITGSTPTTTTDLVFNFGQIFAMN